MGDVPLSDGLCLLVMEGGLSINLDTLTSVGPVAFIIAVAGTMLPIGLGCAFMTAVGECPSVVPPVCRPIVWWW